VGVVPVAAGAPAGGLPGPVAVRANRLVPDGGGGGRPRVKPGRILALRAFDRRGAIAQSEQPRERACVGWRGGIGMALALVEYGGAPW